MRLFQTNEAGKVNFKQARVLIVEDNEDHWALISRAMQQCLSEAGPVLVTTVSEALEILQKYSIQELDLLTLILIDL